MPCLHDNNRALFFKNATEGCLVVCSSGVNFALPVDAVVSIAPNLIISGTHRRSA